MILKRCMFFFLLLVIYACARPLSWHVETQQIGPFGYTAINRNFQLSSTTAGAEAKHTQMFDITMGDMETYQAVITYPSGFTFNGFLALGLAGTQIGSYGVDFEPDGTIDFTIPVYSIDNNNAYADRQPNGTFDSVDSTLAYTNTGGNHVFTITLPNGGDGTASTITGPFTERITAIINSGILTNPATAGTYTATGAFTSVDPDNDNANDNTGTAPTTANFSQDITITSTGGDTPTDGGNNAPSVPQLVFPVDGQTGLATTVVFLWQTATDQDGDTVSYDFNICVNSDFSGCSPEDVVGLQYRGFYLAGVGTFGAGLFIFGFAVMGRSTGRKKTGFFMALIFLSAGLLFSACGESSSSDSSATGEISHTATGLQSSTTYYWKVIADDGNGAATESATQSFTTI